MAESPSSSYSDMEQSFSLAGGEFTEAERAYLMKRGLMYENSTGFMDISTDIGSLDSSNVSQSHVDSLLIFEENERLYSQMLNKSTNSESSPMKVDGSPIQRLETPEKQLRNMSRLSISGGAASPGAALSANEEEDDKENEFKGPIGIQRELFKDEERVRDPLEEIKGKGISEQSPSIDYAASDKSQDDGSEFSDNEICIVPCTQNMSIRDDGPLPDSDNVELVPCTQDVSEKSQPTNTDSDNIEIVPCTQGPNVSYNLNETYTSETLEESLGEVDVEIVPCTQAPEISTLSEASDITRFDELSSVPCSQTSTEGECSSHDFNDTIAEMEYILKKADRLEEKEKLAAERTANEGRNTPQQPASNGIEQTAEPIESAPEVASSQCEFDNKNKEEVEVVFKTPLRHNRVQLLKNKKVASPSPPRSFANALLQQRCAGGKPSAPIPAANDKRMNVVRKDKTGASPSPINTSTPKRAPVTSGTPTTKKNYTPGRGGTMKTPVTAKVDSGLRSGGFPIGLSPVAKYIYDKPVPSKFARVQSVLNPKAATTVTVSNTSLSRIPLAPTRVSQLQTKAKTPGSASKQPRHSVLKTNTYFNLTNTPPQIVGNEQIVEKKRFQPLQYTGASKVKALNGNVESPRTDDYVAHRHIGLRDESGNASFIQNTTIQKRYIPAQSRLVTPKNEKEKDNFKNLELQTTPTRGDFPIPNPTSV